MKSVILSLGIICCSTAAFAGQPEAPRLDPEVIAADTATSFDHSILPVLLFVLFAGAAS